MRRRLARWGKRLGIALLALVAAVTVAAVSLTLLVTGFWLDGLIRTEWLRLLTAYPLVWLGLVGLGFIALDIVMKLLVPFVLAIWSSFAG